MGSRYQRLRILQKVRRDEMKIIRNSARCRRCEEEIESTHRHDFRWCGCGAIAVDGGRSYLRRVGEIEDCEETSVFEEDEG
jgi:Zn finger protein HypA/HybF involved in hydrogenase expression